MCEGNIPYRPQQVAGTHLTRRVGESRRDERLWRARAGAWPGGRGCARAIWLRSARPPAAPPRQ